MPPFFLDETTAAEIGRKMKKTRRGKKRCRFCRGTGTVDFDGQECTRCAHSGLSITQPGNGIAKAEGVGHENTSWDSRNASGSGCRSTLDTPKQCMHDWSTVTIPCLQAYKMKKRHLRPTLCEGGMAPHNSTQFLMEDKSDIGFLSDGVSWENARDADGNPLSGSPQTSAFYSLESSPEYDIDYMYEGDQTIDTNLFIQEEFEKEFFEARRHELLKEQKDNLIDRILTLEEQEEMLTKSATQKDRPADNAKEQSLNLTELMKELKELQSMNEDLRRENNTLKNQR